MSWRAEADGLPPIPADRWSGEHVRETRWPLELVRLVFDPVFRGAGVPHGDGRDVFVMPGFGGGDQTLIVLAGWLRRIGYRPHLCGFIVNVGCSDRALTRVEEQVERVYRRSGRRVALIGHSRGGHYVRALACGRPELVSHAVSLGAGLRQMLAISGPTQSAVGAARWVTLRSGRARSAACLTEGCDCRFAQAFTAPFPDDRVRLTSIYSRDDGVVRWQAALIPYGDCVEVAGSHVGLVFNRQSYQAIAAALARPEQSSGGA